MIIELPEKFQMASPTFKDGAYVENGILKIRRDVSFRKAMAELTYEMKGRKRCCYCKRKVSMEEMTIDHMYPQDFSGPTITNNLLPSCKKCNNEKGNLNTKQYKTFLKAKEEGRRKEFMSDIEQYHNYIRKWEEFDIPKSWITKKEISKITVLFDLEENCSNKKYKKIELYYKNYGHFQKPIIVDKNGFLLDGFLQLLYAKNNNLKNIPAIQLDNVEVIL